MTNPNAIIISKDGKLLAMNKPEKPDRCHECDNIANRVYFLCERCDDEYAQAKKDYELALQSSISSAEKEGIEFKDEVFLISPELHKVRELGIEKFIGQHYPVPSGWEIRVEHELYSSNDSGVGQPFWQKCSEYEYNIYKDGVVHVNVRKVAILVRVEEKKTGVPKSRNPMPPPKEEPKEEKLMDLLRDLELMLDQNDPPPSIKNLRWKVGQCIDELLTSTTNKG